MPELPHYRIRLPTSMDPFSDSFSSSLKSVTMAVMAIFATKRARIGLTVGFILIILILFKSQYDFPTVDGVSWERLGGNHNNNNKDNDDNNSPPPPSSSPDGSAISTTPVDWSRFAYVQYVTNSLYLCNSVMLFETLHRLGAKADRVMMYPSHMLADGPDAKEAGSHDAKIILQARDQYNVKLVPVQVQARQTADSTWAESFTKLLAFNLTSYARVLHLDSDGIVMQPMDELFLLPPSPVAMPRAYWLYPDTQILSSQIMLVQPSKYEFSRIMRELERAGPNDYDMEIVNTLYRDSALIIPHRPYDILTGEFRNEPNAHGKYLQGRESEEGDEVWDAVKIYNEAKFVHFSDWPVPKPWLGMSDSMRREKQPSCGGKNSCVERDFWNGFYDDFRSRKERVCNNGGKRRVVKRRL